MIKIRYSINLEVSESENYFNIDISITLEDRIYLSKISELIVKRITTSISMRDLEN